MAWFCPEFNEKGERCEDLDTHTGPHTFPSTIRRIREHEFQEAMPGGYVCAVCGVEWMDHAGKTSGASDD
jgi:hypothetical protein